MGGRWDVVTWDPRGVGASEPKLKWFNDATEEEGFWSSVIQPGTFEAHGNLTTGADVEFL